MITVTFIRHGESTDNLRSVWAGWADAPLSNHGMNQARALGQSLSSIRLTAIYASTLKRAFTTAQAVHDAQPSPQPPLTASPLLREQHFGIAEGNPWALHADENVPVEDYYAQGVFPVLYERHEKFPGGESLDDVGKRADQAIEEFVIPHIRLAARTGTQGVHIALVSHGLCIGELVAAVIRKDTSGDHTRDYRGLLNTAWTRVTIGVKGLKEGDVLDFADEDAIPLVVKVTEFNRHEHIDNIKRQKGGIGSAAFDPKQQDIRAFFGGGGVHKPVEALEHSESNAADEVGLDQNCIAGSSSTNILKL